VRTRKEHQRVDGNKERCCGGEHGVLGFRFRKVGTEENSTVVQRKHGGVLGYKKRGASRELVNLSGGRNVKRFKEHPGEGGDPGCRREQLIRNSKKGDERFHDQRVGEEKASAYSAWGSSWYRTLRCSKGRVGVWGTGKSRGD